MADLQKKVDALRSFNRLYTQRIGVLNRRLLDSPFSLAEARVLFELAHDENATASRIGKRLELDAGYLSRILHGFSKRRLVARKRSSVDAREFSLSLTAAGRRAFRELDRRSHRQASAMLSALPAPSQDDLLDGIERAKRVLAADASEEKKIVIREPQPGDIGWAIERHGRLYADEFGWNAEFEALVATLFANFATKHNPARERCWIAEVDGQRAGCVFVVRNEEHREVAQLRCLLVDPSARGLGIGRRLVEHCIAFARATGYRSMMLWTNDVLESARKIYEAAGFTLDREYRHRSFGHDLVGQIWSLRFFTATRPRDRATRRRASHADLRN
jgi:DNA-binding MarR family transcriptional regulator/GNAT superfamily N-acetyltransferase